MKKTRIINRGYRDSLELLLEVQSTCKSYTKGDIVVVNNRGYEVDEVIKDFNATHVIVSYHPCFDKKEVDKIRKLK